MSDGLLAAVPRSVARRFAVPRSAVARGGASLAAVPRSGTYRAAAGQTNRDPAPRSAFSGARHGCCPRHVHQEDTE